MVEYNLRGHFAFYGQKALEFLKKMLSPILSFTAYILHNYDTRKFYPLHMKDNIKVLLSLDDENLLSAKEDGKLLKLSSPRSKFFFQLKNWMLFGAPQARVEKVVNLTILAFCIEITNPFNKESLKKILAKKRAVLENLFKKVTHINQRVWKTNWARENFDIYERKTLLQFQEIVWMQKAVKSAKVPLVVLDAQQALKNGLYPLLITRGLSGAYWMRATNRSIAGLFKPFDEELFAPNNPIGANRQGPLGQRKTRPGNRVGESAHREVAAYLVDQFFGFGIVPRTYYATFKHHNFYDALEGASVRRRKDKVKLGSFQEFVEGFTDFDSLTAEEREQIALEEIHLLITLDIIIGNSDRNTGNILVSGEKIAAVDHGLCFTDLHLDPLSLWPMGRLTPGKVHLLPLLQEIFFNFPYQELSWKLKKRCFIQEPCVRRMKERVALFRAGLKADLTPFEMGPLMQPEKLQLLWELDQSLDAKAKEITENYLQDRSKMS